ncbi:MAG TPA: hypothetical protein VF932_01595 [Anaerolineae bacterium]
MAWALWMRVAGRSGQAQDATALRHAPEDAQIRSEPACGQDWMGL